MDALASIWRSVEALEAQLIALHLTNEVSRRLASIPVGPITAMAVANTVTHASAFRSGREFSARLGLTPKSYRAVARIDWDVSPSAASAISATCCMSVRVTPSASPGRDPQTGEVWIRGFQERRPPKIVIRAGQ